MKTFLDAKGHIIVDLEVSPEELNDLRSKVLSANFEPINIVFPEIKILGLKVLFVGNEAPYIYSLPRRDNGEETTRIKSSKSRELP